MALRQSKIFEDEVPLIRSCPALNEIRLMEEIKDLTIELKDGALINVHRIIMAARIPSLRASLKSPCREQNSVLRWQTMPLTLATTLITYVYTGQVELTQVNVREVVVFARKMKLPVLENFGAKFLAASVNLENLATIWEFARSFNIGSVMETCTNIMQSQFQDFVQSDLFVRLPAVTVLSLLRADDLSVNSEEDVVAAVSRWVCPNNDVDQERLDEHAPTMLKEVRWCQTTLQFRKNLVENHKIFKKANECLRVLLQVEQWISSADKDKQPYPFNVRPRQRKEGIADVASCSAATKDSSRQMGIEEKRVAKRPRNDPAVNQPSQRFFLFGKDKDQDRWSVMRFDSDFQTGELVAGMEKRTCGTFSVVGESIFAVGGHTELGGKQQFYSTSVAEFLVREGRWREWAPLPFGRHGHAAAVMKVSAEKTLLAIFGGAGMGGWLSSCEVYDFSRDRWFTLPHMREIRLAPAAATLPGDSRVFVFGGKGYYNHKSVEFCHLRADWQKTVTTEDFWLPAAPMRTARHSLAATPFRGKIIVAGGYNNDDFFGVVSMFSPPDANSPLGQWTELADMKQHRLEFTLLTSSDAVLALGGSLVNAGNTVEKLTPPPGSADSDNDLQSWVWSPKSKVETFEFIWAAASLRL